jgi:tRNA threonylcarbamoyl adenosine modification protein YjeE
MLLKQFENIELESIPEVVDYILDELNTFSVFLLVGNLGAGKSHLVRGILHKIGIQSDVPSPTFTLLNQYKQNSDTYLHADLYRIKNTNQLVEIGFEDAVESSKMTFIEWPDLAKQILQPPFIEIQISPIGNKRNYTFSEIDQI